MPRGPAADPVLVQGGQFLSGGEPVLDFHRDPATFTSWASGTESGMSTVEGVLAVADPPPDQQPVRPVAVGGSRVGGVN